MSEEATSQGEVNIPADPAAAATPEQNPVQNTPATPENPPTPENNPSEATSKPQETPTPETGTVTPIEADVPLEGLKYGDMPVNVFIPKDVANFCQENGVDAEALTKELYESSDFKLSEDSLGPLYEKFGKWQVDAFFDGLKAKNDATINNFKAEQATRQQQAEDAWKNTMEIMEGQDRWNDMSAWAMKNLDPSEIAEFNAVMEKGTSRVQSLMVKDMYSRYKAAGLPPAPTVLDLEEGVNDNNKEGTVQALSRAEYHKILASGEYRKDPAKYDAMRRLGMQKGL